MGEGAPVIPGVVHGSDGGGGLGCASDVVNKHEMLDAVTLKDLHHCLGYFTSDRLTVGTVLPGTLAQEPVPGRTSRRMAWEGLPAPRLAVGKVTRTQRGLYALYLSDRLHLRVHVPLACSHAQKVIMSHLVTKGVKLTRMAGVACATTRKLGDKEVNDVGEEGRDAHGGGSSGRSSVQGLGAP